MSLQVWLPLNGNLAQQGLSNVTATNNGAVISDAGKIGKCYSFNGSNARIACSSNSFSYPLSIACWVKPTNTTGGALQYVLSYSNGDGGYAGHSIGLVIETNGYFYLVANTQNIQIGSAAANNNTWYHIAITIDINKNIKAYINGNQVYSGTSTATKPASSWFTIGARSASTSGANTAALYYFSGLINDVRLYNHVLSSMEVKELSKGLMLHWELSNNGWGQENLVKNSNIEQSGVNWYGYYLLTTNGLSVAPNQRCTISFDAKATVADVKCDVYFRSTSGMNGSSTVVSGITTEWKRFTCQLTCPASNSVSVAVRNNSSNGVSNTSATYFYKNMKVELGERVTPWCPSPEDNLYTILGVNESIEYDCSGYRNNGIQVGNLAYVSDTSRYSVSTKFNGSSAIKNVTFPFSSGQWTLSFWYKYTTAPSAYQGFVCFSRNAGGDSDKKIAAMPNSSYIWMKFESINYSLQSLKVNEWCHIVMTCDGNIGKVYENGVLKYTTGSVGTILTDCDDFVVGARANSANAATTSVYLNNGNMSDVRLYATALSAEDVLALYHTASYIDKAGNNYVYQYIET